MYNCNSSLDFKKMWETLGVGQDMEYDGIRYRRIPGGWLTGGTFIPLPPEPEMAADTEYSNYKELRAQLWKDVFVSSISPGDSTLGGLNASSRADLAVKEFDARFNSEGKKEVRE